MISNKDIKKSIKGIKSYAKSRGYYVEFISDNRNFYFRIYKIKFFGLYKIFLKEYSNIWDDTDMNFYIVWENVRHYIMVDWNK